MPKDRSPLATALRTSTTFFQNRVCVLAFLAVAVLFSGLFWGLYPEPTPKIVVVNATVTQVEGWATKAAPCNTGGSASHMTEVGAIFQYHCQAVKLGNPAYFTILVVLCALVLMVASYPPDLTLLGCTIIFVASGVLTPAQGFVGFSSTAVLSVASMFIVVKCLEENGSVDLVARLFLGKPTTLTGAIARLCIPISIVSMFVLTTPLVCIMIPVVRAWSTRINMPLAKFWIPLSFACIIGGTCTVIGGSPNLVVVGLLNDYNNNIKFNMFDFIPVGAPATIVTVGYLILTSRFLLPNRTATPEGATQSAKTVLVVDKTARKFFSMFKLLARSPMVGFTIEKSGLLTARDLSLIAVQRAEQVFPFDPNFKLEADDYLIFYGIPEGIAQMRRDRSLELKMFGDRITRKRYRRRLIEAVIAADSPLVGVALSDPVFQDNYEATVVGIRGASKSGAIPHSASFKSLASLDHSGSTHALGTNEVSEVRLDVSRASDSGSVSGDGDKIAAPRISSSSRSSFLGPDEALIAATSQYNPNYILLAGDSIVIEAHMNQLFIHKNSDHFSLMREVTDSKPPITDSPIDQFRLVFGGLVLLAIIILAAVGTEELLVCACVGAMILLLVKSITVSEAFHATEPRVLLTVISSFGIGNALSLTGLAGWIAQGIVDATEGGGAFWLIWGIWLLTSVLGCVVGAYAVVVIMFPVCVQAHVLAQNANITVSVKQFVVISLMGASTAFVTPLGYVTSIMVQQQGKLSFADFAKVGLVLQAGIGFLVAYLTMKYIPNHDL